MENLYTSPLSSEFSPENKKNNGGNLSEIIKGNAISAYLMIFISGLFLFNKTNPNINHPFVKAHTKTAMLIHLGFLITYIIFITNNLFASITFMGFGLNNIITDIIYIGLLGLLMIGIYKSKKGDLFIINKNLNISKSKNLIDINGDGKVTEKEKVTVLLSFVPFIGFINYAKHSNNQSIQDGVRFNITISLIIILLSIFSYGNLATLLSLAYIVLITFIGINLFTRDELINIKLPYSFSPSKLYILIISLKNYLKNYFNKDEFKGFHVIKKEVYDKINKDEKINEELLKTKDEFKLPKFLIYIPIINLIFLFFKNTKYSFHIINGLIITLLISITGTLSTIGYFNPSLHILYIFPILFGIGYINNKLAYKIPIVFDIYILFKKIISIFKFGSKKLKEKRNEENEITLKIK